jgi:hypothetical protein
MKNSLFLILIAAMAIAFAGCKKDDKGASVLNINRTFIDAAYTAGTYAIAITSDGAWTASVNSDATWCTVQPVASTAAGIVTVYVATNVGAVSRTATVTFTAGTLNQTISVTQAAIQLHIATTQTWTLGNQTWSDRILCPECNKETFEDSYTDPQCHSYTESGKTFYYYNWSFVNTDQAAMCPAPWRVPTLQDFDALVGITDVATLISDWNYGGHASGGGVDAMGASYWSLSESNANDKNAHSLFFFSDMPFVDGGMPFMENIFLFSKNYGMQVRCVK